MSKIVEDLKKASTSGFIYEGSEKVITDGDFIEDNDLDQETKGFGFSNIQKTFSMNKQVFEYEELINEHLRTIDTDQIHGRIDGQVVCHYHKQSPLIKEFQNLKTNLISLTKRKGFKSFLFTGCSKDDGTSITVANLAVLLSQEFESKVCMIDMDSKQHSLTNYFGLEATRGLLDVIVKTAKISEVVKLTGVKNLYLIPSYNCKMQSCEILKLKELNCILEALKKNFDYILIDGMPYFEAEETKITGSNVDGVILVARSLHTQRERLTEAYTNLRRANANVVGTALTKTKNFLPQFLQKLRFFE